MPKRAPNFFDELPRMRMPANGFDPSMDYRRLIDELRLACEANRFIGISPHNVVRGVPLVRVIASRDDDTRLRFFIDPHVVSSGGARARYEGCGNLYLVKNGKRFHPGFLTVRPTRVVVSFRDENGRSHTQRFVDYEAPESVRNGFVGVIAHEIDHLHGKLLVDIARDHLDRSLKRLGDVLTEEELTQVYGDMPFVLLLDGDRYVLRFGAELIGESIPPVSPDAFFFSPGIEEAYDIACNIDSFRVPRAGELLPIRLSSKMIQFIAEAR